MLLVSSDCFSNKEQSWCGAVLTLPFARGYEVSSNCMALKRLGYRYFFTDQINSEKKRKKHSSNFNWNVVKY